MRCNTVYHSARSHSLTQPLSLSLFQEDKDLVHEFVQNEGLSCLVQVGSTADQKYQNYILRGGWWVESSGAEVRFHSKTLRGSSRCGWPAGVFAAYI